MRTHMIIADRYSVKKRLADGKMSQVYLCRDDDDLDNYDNNVVVKVFNKSETGDSNLQTQSFYREMESLKKVQHDKIVNILDCGEDEELNIFFITLEYISGKTFQDEYNAIFNLDFQIKLQLAYDLLDGVDYLHKHGIIHRDLKPSNIMSTNKRAIKIIDFGISHIENAYYDDFTLAACNTERYASPEQLLHKNITHKTDIYSMGLIFFEIFAKQTIGINKELLVFDDLPKTMQPIIAKMLKENAADRYDNVSDIKREFHQLIEKYVNKRVLVISLTNKIVDKLYATNYISNKDAGEACRFLEEEFGKSCYFALGRDKENKYNNRIELYTQQVVLILAVDRKDRFRFTIIGIHFFDVSVILRKVETAYENPYRLVMSNLYGNRAEDVQVSAQKVVDEIIDFESNRPADYEQALKKKGIVLKWKSILNLQEESLKESKSKLWYTHAKINERDYTLEVDLPSNTSFVEFASEEMLEITTKDSLSKMMDVGRLRSVTRDHLIIDMLSDIDYGNIAPSGEISRSLRRESISLQRQSKALRQIQYGDCANKNISEIIFDPTRAMSKNNLFFNDRYDLFKSSSIDTSKIKSIEKALSSEDIFLLQGPPGTGKTTFISELVYQILNGNKYYSGDENARILIASQSNVAVDHSLNKIKELIPEISLVRIGSPEKIAESSQTYTLEEFRKSWKNEVIQNSKKQLAMYKASNDLIKTNGSIEKKETLNIKKKYQLIERLCEEWQDLVSKGDGLFQESIADASVVGATCLGVANIIDDIDFSFDWVIIDEAGKATPPELMVPLCLGKKVVLVGDHKQLPPVVDDSVLNNKSAKDISAEDLEKTLFEYLEETLNEDCKHILKEQYRMNPVIGELISQMFYDNQLVSKVAREQRSLNIKTFDNKPLVWLSTSSRDNRHEEKIGETYRNVCEAEIIFEQLVKIDNELNEKGVCKEVAIIAGYKGQKDKLVQLYESGYRDKFKAISLEINTVDAFQGRETDIVFYSIVRSNQYGNLGFLKDIRRLNVAFSRARELLVVVGDHHCAQQKLHLGGIDNPFIGIIDYIYRNNDDCIIMEV